MNASHTISVPNVLPFQHYFHTWEAIHSVLVPHISLNPVSKHRCNISTRSRRRSWAHKGMCVLGITLCMYESTAVSVQQTTELLQRVAGKQPETDRLGEGILSPQGSTARWDRNVTQRLCWADSEESSFSHLKKASKQVALLPWCPVYPESLYGDVWVLQVHTVCEQRLDIVKVLWFELRHWGESVVILLDQLSHKVLIEGQLMVPRDYYLKLIR